MTIHPVGKYSIKDLEKLSGIKAHTIRTWEKRYGVLRPERTGTNIRYYSGEELRHILNISLLLKNGYRISAVSEMTPNEIINRLSELTMVKPVEDGFQESLLLSMIELNEAQFNKTFLTVVINMGFEKAVAHVIFPFFERIGVMWQTATINPAQEHFISNIVRQKLILATEMLQVVPARDAPTVLLFLPEPELHELALLFYNYAFRARGYKTIYLGQAVPQDNLERVTSITNPDYIVTGITNSLDDKGFQHFVTTCARTFAGKKIYYTGPVPLAAHIKLPRNAYPLKELLNLLGMEY
ncbi:MerR family transcriptional regulator [Chitinophaga agrisoli]|uniref:MerR family transcriptional regulator n=1 Tax=Chitinophaga agrisoli TaxID=2607653 RepID=A0A5B2VW96_9BACT|nr:MerR family transcriptional regulator [Chitinophaga agrisoli]KAA2243581.1 MerR family transcriptional regulator [Chitinophaga agrisoli]